MVMAGIAGALVGIASLTREATKEWQDNAAKKADGQEAAAKWLSMAADVVSTGAQAVQVTAAKEATRRVEDTRAAARATVERLHTELTPDAVAERVRAAAIAQAESARAAAHAEAKRLQSEYAPNAVAERLRATALAEAARAKSAAEAEAERLRAELAPPAVATRLRAAAQSKADALRTDASGTKARLHSEMEAYPSAVQSAVTGAIASAPTRIWGSAKRGLSSSVHHAQQKVAVKKEQRNLLEAKIRNRAKVRRGQGAAESSGKSGLRSGLGLGLLRAVGFKGARRSIGRRAGARAAGRRGSFLPFKLSW